MAINKKIAGVSSLLDIGIYRHSSLLYGGVKNVFYYHNIDISTSFDSSSSIWMQYLMHFEMIMK